MTTGRYRSRLRPWSAHVVDLLVMHPEGVERESVIENAKSLVPPGRAYRRARHRDIARVSTSQSVLTGSRQIVRDSIRSMMDRKSIEKYELDGQVYLRLTDEGKRRLIVGKE